MKALVYVKGENITEQVNICKTYAEERGYKILTFAGVNDDLSKMVGNLEIDVLLIADRNRVSKNAENFDFLEKVLSWHGVKIEEAGENK